MRRSTIALAIVSAAPIFCKAQVPIDSISYEGLSQGFWGIHVTPDTIFLGADFSGNVHYSDHTGTILGSLPSGYDFNHGLIASRTLTYWPRTSPQAVQGSLK